MNERVVVTGIGAVTPLGCSREKIWNAFQANESALRECEMAPGFSIWFGRVTEDLSESARSTLSFLTEDEREAAAADRGVSFAMKCVDDAMREAGIDMDRMARDRVGVFVSSSKGQLRSLLEAHLEFREEGPAKLHANGARFTQLFRNFPGDFVGQLVARKYGIEGPVLNYPAACATGLNSMISAIPMLLEGTLDMAIVGSSESSGNAVTLAAFSNMGAIAPHHVRPFHKDRLGFSPGEGAGVLILERESEARKRGAKILGTVRGWDFRSDAHHMTAVEPGGSVIEHSIRRTLKRAGWDPSEVEYINAHGTGTHLNDATEAAAIERVFGAPGPYVSSLKAAIGHLLGASSGAEMALIMLTLGHGFVPPTLLLDDPDPEFHLNFVPDGGLNRHVKKYLKFSYGFGGHIAIVAMESGEPLN